MPGNNITHDWELGSLERECQALSAELKAIDKRFWWLAGAAFLGLCGTIRALSGGEAAHDLRRSFGEFGVNASYWALIIGGVWFVYDIFRARTARNRLGAASREFEQRKQKLEARELEAAT